MNEKDKKILENLGIIGSEINAPTSIASGDNSQSNIEIEKKNVNNNDKYAPKILQRIEQICNFTGKNLSTIIQNSGLIEKDINSLKNGHAPSFYVLYELAKNLDCTVDFLLYGNVSNGNDYFNKLNQSMEKYDISYERLSGWSGIPIWVLDCLGKGFIPMCQLDWRIKNSIYNLSAKNDTFELKIDYDKYNYYICEKDEAKNYIDMLQLPSEKQDKVRKYIEKIKGE